jgi:anti-sigma-K factor RskA
LQRVDPGGLEPDLDEELYWWQSDDFWRYALVGLAAVVRASAALRGLPVAELAERLGERHGVSVTGTE